MIGPALVLMQLLENAPPSGATPTPGHSPQQRVICP